MSHGQISNEEQANYERQIAEQWQYSDEFKAEIDKIMAGEKGLSFSSLKEFLQSPMHFYRYKTDKKQTKSMDEGIMFHMSILEPEKFDQSYFVIDDTAKCAEIGGATPRNTNLYKQWFAQQIADNPSKQLIKKEDYDNYKKMGSYLRRCSATKDFIEGLKSKEEPFDLEYEGFKITGKIDGIGNDYIIDLKKVADASIQKVKWIIRDNLYGMQGAIYSMAKNKSKYILIFIDNDCECTVVKLSPETLAEGLAKFDGAINSFRDCVEADGGFFSSYEWWSGGYTEL